jgi:hypothetical protein
MQTIDFLPQVYRERNDLRKARTWWAVVLMVFGTVVVSTASIQYTWRRTVVRQLDDLGPRYAAAMLRDAELARLQTQIQAVSDAAGLYTYLQHPWPRTQLLAAVVAPVPKSIRLTDVLLTSEVTVQTTSDEASVASRRARGRAEKNEKREPPARQDLARLRDECDTQQTVVHITGTATDVQELHVYVGELGKSPLVASALLKSIEAIPQEPGASPKIQFRVQMVVRPGYGQRGGPEPKAAAPVAREMPRENPRYLAGGTTS